LLRIPGLSLAPLDLRLVGRTLLHAALVGAAAGLLGAAFFYGLELAQHVLLERLTGYVPLHAKGETEALWAHAPFRPWALWLLPALGALLGGALSAFLAPETRGGGGDAMIDAFHRHDGVIRRRVVFVKGLASIFTLGSGGSGGREGPTMHIGAAIGSIVGRYLRVDARERRILVVAGCAAGIAAVFRTPLGAALLAVEILYRDDFESDALVPALLASVLAYSVFVSIHGESKLFAHALGYPFVPVHLPLYGLMALTIAFFALTFLALLRWVQKQTARVPVPIWIRPALGGLGVGIIATGAILVLGPRVHVPGQGFGILGGGYGAAQLAITGSAWLPNGWRAVELLALLGLVKIVVTSLTVGSGGSAGDFGPSLVIGGLFGGAFGRAAQLLLHDPRIDPGAFALVGMGTFYGGIAHVPVSSLVMVCELAGSYDLLVPLMLAEAIAFVALRKRSLYPAQTTSKRESPAHHHENNVLAGRTVAEILVRERDYVTFSPRTSLSEIIEGIASCDWQDTFPVIDGDRGMVGIIDASIVRALSADPDLSRVSIAADIMQPAVSVNVSTSLHKALDAMVERGLREIPVTDDDARIVGFLDEADITLAYLRATEAEPPPSSRS